MSASVRVFFCVCALSVRLCVRGQWGEPRGVARKGFPSVRLFWQNPSRAPRRGQRKQSQANFEVSSKSTINRSTNNKSNKECVHGVKIENGACAVLSLLLGRLG